MPSYQYNEKQYTLPELRLLFPHISFPADPTADDVPAGVVVIPDPAPDPAAALAEAKSAHLQLLAERFEHTEAFGHFGSSLGFEVDATGRTSRDVAGLLTLMESTGQSSAYFCDYGNTMRPVTLADVKALQLEILVHGQQVYARKWALREAILSAETVETVQGIEISFDDLPAPVVPTGV